MYLNSRMNAGPNSWQVIIYNKVLSIFNMGNNQLYWANFLLTLIQAKLLLWNVWQFCIWISCTHGQKQMNVKQDSSCFHLTYVFPPSLLNKDLAKSTMVRVCRKNTWKTKISWESIKKNAIFIQLDIYINPGLGGRKLSFFTPD